MPEPYFKITRSTAIQPFHFNLHAPNHEPILHSENYATKDGAQNGIRSAKTNATLDSRYERKRTVDGQFMFNLSAANHEIIGTSERYTTEQAREGGIAAVKQYAPIAGLVDES